MDFALTTPCANCPFRTDITFPLHPERVDEILDSLLYQDGSFPCHKTLTPAGWDDDDTTYTSSGTEQHCAGALILLERCDRPNQVMRIAERLGVYDRRRLAMDAPVFATPAAMRRHMRQLDRRERQRARRQR